MAICSVLLNAIDVVAEADFFERYLDAASIEVSEDRAVLDVGTALVEINRVGGERVGEAPFGEDRVDEGKQSTWIPDDIQAGPRHIGFKVSDLDERVRKLQEDGVQFHLEPIDAAGEVRITFFYSPSGVLVEMVEGALQHHWVADQSEVDADWGLGTPTRPRFDHVAETVQSFDTSGAFHAGHGFKLMGGIHQSADPRGFEIAYLRGDDTTLELFEFRKVELQTREPQWDAPGFVAAVFDSGEPEGDPVAVVAGRPLFSDPDGLLFATGPLPTAASEPNCASEPN